MSTIAHWAGLLSVQKKYLTLLRFQMTQHQTQPKEYYSKCPEPSFASP